MEINWALLTVIRIKKWQAVRELDASLLERITFAAKFYQKSISYEEIGDSLKSSNFKNAYKKALGHLEIAFENAFCNHFKRLEPIQQLIGKLNRLFIISFYSRGNWHKLWRSENRTGNWIFERTGIWKRLDRESARASLELTSLLRLWAAWNDPGASYRRS